MSTSEGPGEYIPEKCFDFLGPWNGNFLQFDKTHACCEFFNGFKNDPFNNFDGVVILYVNIKSKTCIWHWFSLYRPHELLMTFWIFDNIHYTYTARYTTHCLRTTLLTHHTAYTPHCSHTTLLTHHTAYTPRCLAPHCLTPHRLHTTLLTHHAA